MNIELITIEEFEKDILKHYEELFPVDEQREWDTVIKTYNLGVEKFYKICIDDKVIGFFMLEKINDLPYYLDFFGIFLEYQNMGYGSMAMKLLLEKLDNNLCLEIESIDDKDTIKLKRLEFYKRLGFYLYDSIYKLYDTTYNPMINSKLYDKEVLDNILVSYYKFNMGEDNYNNNCCIIK